MRTKEKDADKNRLLGGSATLLCAIFMAIASVVYIMYKSWSNKAYAEKWADYDECGI